MNVVLSFLALTLLAADAPRPPAPLKPSISLGQFVVVTDTPPPSAPKMVVFQVQVVEMSVLDWRSKHQTKLTAATDHDRAGVWTAPAALVSELVKASSSTPTRVKLVADSEKFAHFQQRGNQTNALTDAPQTSPSKTEKSREGIAATLMGRKLDQGVLTKIVIEETRVLATHKVPTVVNDHFPVDASLQQVSIPEVATAEVAGEWLIPNDGALILSLGVHTVADAESKAVVKERLALIEANPPAHKVGKIEINGHSRTKGQLHSISVTRTEVPAAIALPFAAVPSRSLPQPLDAKGKPVELPPLPEFATPTTLSSSSEPCAAPQCDLAEKPALLTEKTLDLETMTAGVTTGEPAESTPELSDWKVAPIKSFSFRLPGNGIVSVEIRAMANPNFDAPLPPVIPLPVPKAK